MKDKLVQMPDMFITVLFNNIRRDIMLRLKKIFSCILAVTAIMGGSTMSAMAVNEKNYAHELDKQAYYGGDLGAVYTKKATTFKVWAPTAERVTLKLYATGSSGEEGAQDISTTAMTKGDKGVWSVKLDGDKKNLYYTYLITINGVTTETADVYSKAVGVNGNRSMVVDLKSTDPEGWDKDQHILYDDPTDAIVWEVHVRDFSKSEISGVSLKHKGKYLAFTENGTTLGEKGEVPTCIDYLKKLGVTHVQLLPVYDYATVDESKENTDEYNWGYDPKNYNVPEGSYSTNPFDGNVRITEFKQMIKALHDAGIGVIMDVVYNHTFTAKGGCFENTVPGYYYRLTPDGELSDGSGCGNETASDHLMYRKYMIDSVIYWASEYHIDGFRFDLMGIHDVETMNLIRKALDEKIKDGKKIIMYGEPWTGGALSTNAKTCVKDNVKLLNERIGAFNDNFRDAVKGHVFNAEETGYIQTGSGADVLKPCIAANCTEVNSWLNQPSQSVTYTSAHDNFTLYDKLVLSVKKDDSFDERDDDLIAMNKLSAAIMFTSQGINFMQAGEEFARTKFGDENSFVSPDKINQLNWNNLVTFADLNSYYQGMIEIRKHYKPFRDPSANSAKKIAFSDTDKGVVAYTLENSVTKDKEWSYVAVAFNATDEPSQVKLKQSGDTALPSSWEIIADGVQAGLDGLGEIKGDTVTVAPHSALVLADKESFDKVGAKSGKCVVNIEYKDTGSGEVIKKQVIKGSEGEGYSVVKDSSLDIDYDFDSVEGNEKGRFTKEPQTVTYKYNKFNGKICDLTVKYLKEGDSLLGTKESEVAEAVTQRVRDGYEYNAPIRTVDGMRIKADRFPSNATGKVSGQDIEVTFYYEPVGAQDLIIHYFDTKKRDKVFAYVYAQTEDGEDVYSDDTPGSEMKADAGLGEGWYTFTMKDRGAIDGLKLKISDTKGEKVESFDRDIKGEFWIENGVLTPKGEVTVLYVGSDGGVMDSQILSGKAGTVYTTEQLNFENMNFAGSTDNTEGTYTQAPIYVIYSYYPISIVEKPVMPVIMLLAGSSLLTVIAAAALGVVYNKKKKA